MKVSIKYNNYLSTAGIIRFLPAVISFLFLLITDGYAQDTVAVDSSYLNSHYVQRLAFFRQMPAQKKEIVFLGNSITEGGEWQELIPGKHVLNRGISGDVTFGVLARLDEVVSSKPSKIFILIGINDLKRGIPAGVILANYHKMISYIKEKSPHSKIYIQSILPVNKYMLPESYKKITNDIINSLNIKLREFAKAGGIGFIDLHKVFEDKNGQLPKELSIDGLHLRSAAYINWVNYLKEVHAL